MINNEFDRLPFSTIFERPFVVALLMKRILFLIIVSIFGAFLHTEKATSRFRTIKE